MVVLARQRDRLAGRSVSVAEYQDAAPAPAPVPFPAAAVAVGVPRQTAFPQGVDPELVDQGAAPVLA